MQKIRKLPPAAPPSAETLEQMLRRIRDEAAVGICAAGFEGIDRAARKLKKALIKGLSGK
jgi:hypothetical protein